MDCPGLQDDPDYVDLFQQLARVQMHIQDQGPVPRLLLQRAWLELGMGDYAAAKESASDAMSGAGHHAEAAFVAAEAALRHALAASGVAVWSPGHPVQSIVDLDATLREAREGFAALKDPQVAGRVVFIDALLAQLARGRTMEDAVARAV